MERILQRFDPSWETRNFGVSGATILKQGDWPYVNQGTYHQALASEPDVVILCFGANGSRSPNRGYIQEYYVSDYLSLIDSFTALPSKPEIWICYPLKALLASHDISDTIIREQIVPFITQIASERNLPIIDFYAASEDSPHLFQGDGIHPNSSGTDLMSKIVATFITGVGDIPDFNGDGIVDSADMCTMVDHWHTNDSVCDVAPLPRGDGIVDVQDLVVLAQYLFKPFTDITLVAHWPLDEVLGGVAYDSVVDNDGTLMGDPVWQPDGGMVAGALRFDGIDDHISTGPVLNPADGVFSVLVWLKGGVPGQAIISQEGGWNWLMADMVYGALRTDLRTPETIGRNAKPPGPPLICTTTVTDGDWHRVGFVRDSSDRILYVDDIEVARDTAETLESAEGGLYIGAASALEPGGFFSGLIDDIRIYNRAVTP